MNLINVFLGGRIIKKKYNHIAAYEKVNQWSFLEPLLSEEERSLKEKKRLFILNGDTSNNMQVVCLNSAYFSRRVPEDCKYVQCRFNAKIYVEHVPRSDKI